MTALLDEATLHLIELLTLSGEERHAEMGRAFVALDDEQRVAVCALAVEWLRMSVALLGEKVGGDPQALYRNLALDAAARLT